MERIEVTTRFRRDGSLSPLDFKIQEDLILVSDVGRQWDTEEGKHILVMDFQNQTYHLLFQLQDLSWYLVRDTKPPEVFV